MAESFAGLFAAWHSDLLCAFGAVSNTPSDVQKWWCGQLHIYMVNMHYFLFSCFWSSVSNIHAFNFSNETSSTISKSETIEDKCPLQNDFRNFKLENCNYECKGDRARSKRQAENSFEYDYEDSKSGEGKGDQLVFTRSRKVSPEQIKIQSEVIPPHICHNNGSLLHCHVYLPETIVALRMVEYSLDESDSCKVPLSKNSILKLLLRS